MLIKIHHLLKGKGENMRYNINYKSIILLSVSFLLIYIIINKIFFTELDIKSDEISTDIDMIHKNFNKIKGVEYCYWKVEIIGNDRTVGPQSYKFRAFIKINKDEAEVINNSFSFETEDIQYDKTILPLKKCDNLKLVKSSDLSQYILSTLWVGHISFDYSNQMIYLEATNT